MNREKHFYTKGTCKEICLCKRLAGILCVVLFLFVFGFQSSTGQGKEVSVWDGGYDITWYTDNRSADEFYIYTAEELSGIFQVGKQYGEKFKGKTIYLMEDICLTDLTGYVNDGKNKPKYSVTLPNNWNASQYYNYEFLGCLEGNNHHIDGLYTVASEESVYKGLFPVLGKGAEIRNLYMDCPTVMGILYKRYIGVLAGKALGASISNCHISSAYIYYADYAGGLVGYADEDTTIDNCSFQGTINKCLFAGGLAGYTGNATICHSQSQTGMYESTVSTYAGGIVGKAGIEGIEEQKRTIIQRCESRCDFSNDGPYTGGAIGYGINTLTEVVSVEATIQGKHFVGGLFGYSKDNVVCHCLIRSQSATNEKGAGVAGELTGALSIKNSLIDMDCTGKLCTEVIGNEISPAKISKEEVYCYLHHIPDNLQFSFSCNDVQDLTIVSQEEYEKGGLAYVLEWDKEKGHRNLWCMRNNQPKLDVFSEYVPVYQIVFHNCNDGDKVCYSDYCGVMIQDIPKPEPINGYTVTWNKTKFSPIHKDEEVFPVYVPRQCKVRFMQNGEVVAEEKVTYGSSLYLLPEIPYIPGYTGSWGKDSEKIVNVTKDMCLELIYSPIRYHLVYQDSFDEESYVVQECLYDRSYEYFNNPFFHDGYHFVGWNTQKNGEGQYFSSKEVFRNLSSLAEKRIILYAIWEKDSQWVDSQLKGYGSAIQNNDEKQSALWTNSQDDESEWCQWKIPLLKENKFLSFGKWKKGKANKFLVIRKKKNNQKGKAVCIKFYPYKEKE